MSDTSLTDFVDSVCPTSHLRVETDLGGGFVRLRSDEAQRRQAAHDIRSTEDALIELLRNSRDAHAHSIFIATTKANDIRQLLVIDDGDGIPAFMNELIFEPRVTSKLDTMHIDKWGVHGRGMALYAVKENAQACGVVQSQVEKGTALFAHFDTKVISEKADQSTFPSFTLSEENRVSLRGPKNIIRTSCEFAFECREVVSVYLGSPVEIAATLYSYGTATLSVLDRTFTHDESSLPLTKRLALAADEESFCATAHSLGIELSSRSAHRILEGHIKPLDTLLDQIQNALFCRKKTSLAGHAPAQAAISKAGSMQRHRKIASFSSDDLATFTQDIQHDYKKLAQAYYLSDQIDINAHVKENTLIVRIPLVPDESL